jgi:hypothetical protein
LETQCLAQVLDQAKSKLRAESSDATVTSVMSLVKSGSDDVLESSSFWTAVRNHYERRVADLRGQPWSKLEDEYPLFHHSMKTSSKSRDRIDFASPTIRMESKLPSQIFSKIRTLKGQTGGWTPEEDRLIFTMHVNGSSWSAIEAAIIECSESKVTGFTIRSQNNIKNRWNAGILSCIRHQDTRDTNKKKLMDRTICQLQQQWMMTHGNHEEVQRIRARYEKMKRTKAFAIRSVQPKSAKSETTKSKRTKPSSTKSSILGKRKSAATSTSASASTTSTAIALTDKNQPASNHDGTEWLSPMQTNDRSSPPLSTCTTASTSTSISTTVSTSIPPQPIPSGNDATIIVSNGSAISSSRRTEIHQRAEPAHHFTSSGGVSKRTKFATSLLLLQAIIL